MELLLLDNFLQDSDDEVNIVFNILNNNKTLNYAVLMRLQKCVSVMRPKIVSTEQWLIKYDNFNFYKLFRMQKISFEKLGELVGFSDTENILKPTYRGGHHPIDLRSQVLIFIWYMATMDTLLSIGTRFNISPTSVMNITNKLLFFMLKLKNQLIKFPSTEQLEVVANGFHKYPGTIGALDGTHIFVKVPSAQHDSYTDRYRRQSINLMAICDSTKMFTYVFVGFPGSAHDSRVFENSIFCKNVERFGPNHIFNDCEKYHLIADSAFPLKIWLMAPYRDNGHLTRLQKKHNQRLSSDRVVIEHAFGLLKGRWRRLQFINTYNIYKTIEIALTGCVLHNFCLLNDDLWDVEFIEDVPFQPQENRFAGDQRQAKLKRDNIANLLNRE